MQSIPDEKLPSEFKDEARLDSLFSPFRSRSTNPRDWTSKVSAWKHLIKLYCQNNEYTFTLSSLNSLFVRNGRPPICLNVVIEESLKCGDIQSSDDFFKKSPQTWSGWATDILVKKPISWSFNTIKRSLFSPNVNPESVYVHVGVIREDSQKLLAAYPDKFRNRVVDFDKFMDITKTDPTQGENAKLLLNYLVQEHKTDVATLRNNSDGTAMLIKIGNGNKVIPISEVEIGVYVLEQNETVFTKHVEELEDEIAACLKTIKGHLVRGHRQLAKTCLKRKHEIEKGLTRKLNALHNIQVLLEKIRDVHTDAEVWQSYKHALSAFDTTFKDTGMNEESVEDTMLQLGEMLDIHEDIQNAISKPVIEEDSDLEEELAELMQSEQKPGGNNNGNQDIDEQLSNLNLDNLPNIQDVKVSEKINV